MYILSIEDLEWRTRNMRRWRQRSWAGLRKMAVCNMTLWSLMGVWMLFLRRRGPRQAHLNNLKCKFCPNINMSSKLQSHYIKKCHEEEVWLWWWAPSLVSLCIMTLLMLHNIKRCDNASTDFGLIPGIPGSLFWLIGWDLIEPVSESYETKDLCMLKSMHWDAWLCSIWSICLSCLWPSHAHCLACTICTCIISSPKVENWTCTQAKRMLIMLNPDISSIKIWHDERDDVLLHHQDPYLVIVSFFTKMYGKRWCTTTSVVEKCFMYGIISWLTF